MHPPNKVIFFIGLFLFLITNCKKETITPTSFPDTNPPLSPRNPTPEDCIFQSFKMDGASCALDFHQQTFYYPIHEFELDFSPLIEVTDRNIEIYINNQLINNFEVNNLGLVRVNEVLPITFTECDGTQKEYKLIFTRHPVIQFFTNGQTIEDDFKIPITFKINDPDYLAHGNNQREFSSYAGIELRGSSALFHPKKSFGIELWQDESGSEKLDASLLGFRDDDDWILNAMYKDKSRMRNRVSMDIWMDFQSIYYQDELPKANNGIRGQLVEVFRDQRYRGLFHFAERMDRKQLQLEKLTSSNPHGLLYKAISQGDGIVTFEDYYQDFDPGNSVWDGWEQKFPDPEHDFIEWEPLAEFTSFVIESNDDTFINQIQDQVILDNMVDYFIFLNLTKGFDNTGKNIYFTKQSKSEPFFITPWDLDGTWGRYWNGVPISASGLLSNGLFDRLISTNPNEFRAKLKNRWFTARSNIFSKQQLLSYFEIYGNILIQNGSFDREKNKWEMSNTLPDELEYISNWLDDRLNYLDNYFETL